MIWIKPGRPMATIFTVSSMAFFLFVFAWTWSFWIIEAALGLSVSTVQGYALLLLGGFGPMVGGIGFAWFTRSGGSWKAYWMRILDPRLICAGWWAATLLLAPALMALAIAGAVASGDVTASTALRSNAVRFLADPSSLVGFVLSVLVLGPLPEELGWRGYALERLQTRHSPLAAALILGFVWALWHIPLFFLRDMLHWSHGVGSAWFWLFMVQVPCLSVVMSWLFNNTRHSTLAAILFHFSVNFAFALGNVTERTNIWATVLWIAAAVAIARRWSTAR